MGAVCRARRPHHRAGVGAGARAVADPGIDDGDGAIHDGGRAGVDGDRVEGLIVPERDGQVAPVHQVVRHGVPLQRALDQAAPRPPQPGGRRAWEVTVPDLCRQRRLASDNRVARWLGQPLLHPR
jgi:hypothetical protein